MVKNLKHYSRYFTEADFWKKIKAFARKAGVKTVYISLLLYYAYKRKETPAWAKRVIIGVLGYLIMPIDVIPDLQPFLGFTDDFGLLSMGLVTIAGYVNDEVREKAREKLSSWFPDTPDTDLEEVDKKL